MEICETNPSVLSEQQCSVTNEVMNGDQLMNSVKEIAEDFDEDETQGLDCDSDEELGVPSTHAPHLLVDETSACNVTVDDSLSTSQDTHAAPPAQPTDIQSTEASTISPAQACLETERTEGGVPVPAAHRGMLQKLSVGFLMSRWEQRFFHLERGALVYFEPVHWFLKGQFDLVDLQLVERERDNADLVIRLKNARGGPEIQLLAEDTASKQLWVTKLKEHIEFAKYISIQMKKLLETPENERKTNRRGKTDIPPPIAHGWLHKKGQIFPTIRKRYFLLQHGVLSYYRQDLQSIIRTPPIDGMKIPAVSDATNEVTKLTEDETRSLPRPLGKFVLYDYQLYSDSSEGRIELMLMPGLQSRSKRKMLIYCENYADRDRWVRAINEHASFIPTD